MYSKNWQGYSFKYVASLIVSLLGATAAGIVLLGVLAPPAANADTDGGGGSSSTGGACILHGWRVVDTINGINANASGAGSACGNDVNPDKTNLTDKRNAVYRHGASGCRNADINGQMVAIWYLQDRAIDNDPSTWATFGVNPSTAASANSNYPLDNSRNMAALQNAIKSETGSNPDYTPNNNLTNTWWKNHILRYLSDYPNHPVLLALSPLPVDSAAAVTIINQFKEYLASTTWSVIPTNPNGSRSPVIFCWFKVPAQSTPGPDCSNVPGTGIYAKDPAMTGVGAYADFSNCFLKCPTNSIAHAGEWLPIALGTQAQRNDYCWPPQPVDRTDRNWTSEIWGWDNLLDGGTVGGNAPYGWNTFVLDVTPDVDGQTDWEPIVKFQKSDFGEFWDKYCSADEGCNPGRTAGDCTNFANAYRAATNADNPSGWQDDKRAAVDFDATHKKALAEGRVLEVRENEFPTFAYCNLQIDQLWTRHCVGVNFFNFNGSLDPARSTNTCGVPENNGSGPLAPGSWNLANEAGNPDRPYNVTELAGRTTQRLARVYQFITNHCNSIDFMGVMPEYGSAHWNKTSNQVSGAIYSGDSTMYLSASAVSPLIDGDDISLGNRIVPWGINGGPTIESAGMSESSRPEFFDRLCAYDGKLSNPKTNEASAKSADQGADGWSFFRNGEWQNTPINYMTPDPDAMSDTDVPDGFEKTVTEYVSGPTYIASGMRYKHTGNKTVTEPNYDKPMYTGVFADNRVACDNKKIKGTVVQSGTWVSANNWSTGGVWVPANGNATASKGGIMNGVQALRCGWSHNPGPTEQAASGNWLKKRVYTLSYVSYPEVKTTTQPVYEWVPEEFIGSYEEAEKYYNQCALNSVAKYPVLGDTKDCEFPKQHEAAKWTTKTTKVDVCEPESRGDYGQPGWVSVNCRGLNKTGGGVSVVKYKAEDPTQTVITRDLDGTPDLDKFNMRAVSCRPDGGTSSDLFVNVTGENEVPPTQRKFTMSGDFYSAGTAIVEGCWTGLESRSIWSSEKGRPQVFTARWRFNPIVTNNGPVSNVGFGLSHGAPSWDLGNLETNIEGMVWSARDKKSDAQSQNLTWNYDAATNSKEPNFDYTQRELEYSNSGTDIPNNLDYPLFYGDYKDGTTKQWKKNPMEEIPGNHYWVLKFVRATTE